MSIKVKNEIKYEDVTKEWLRKATPNSHIIRDMNYYEYNGIKYKVDGKNVVLDYSKKEKEIAIWLEETFGGEIYMCPRVNKPKGIKTPDYIYKGESWDLKEINGNGKYTLDSAINKQKNQANNFIFDVSSSKLDNENIYKQLENIYENKNRYWLDKIIIKRDNKLIKIFQRKRE